MDIEATIRDGLPGWTFLSPPASPSAIQDLVSVCPIALPEEYLSLLRFSNGGEGELGIEPGWFVLWPTEDVLVSNQEYGVPEFLPGFFGFGSNGGGELLALDLRNGPPFGVAMVPFIPMDVDDAVTIAESFAEFLKALGRTLSD